MRTGSVNHPVYISTQQTLLKKTNDNQFYQLLLNQAPNTETIDLENSQVDNPINILDMLTALGLSTEDIKVFQNFVEKLEQGKDDTNGSLLPLLESLQNAILLDAGQIQEDLESHIKNEDLLNLLNQSSFPNELDLRLAYIIIMNQAISTDVNETKGTLKDSFILNHDMLKFFNHLKNELIQMTEYNSSKQKLLIPLQPIEDHLTKIINNEHQVQSQLNKNEYLRQLFQRSFRNPSVQTTQFSANSNINDEALTTFVKQEVTAVQLHQNSGEQLSVPLNRTQQFILYINQHQSENMLNQERFIQDFKNILAKSQFNQANGQAKLLIKLYPEHLGSLQIELIHQDKMLVAKILASTANAKELIESQIQNLKQTMVAQNIPIEKIEISQQLQQQFERSTYRDQQHGHKHGNQHPDQQNHREHDSNGPALSFEEELLNFQV